MIRSQSTAYKAFPITPGSSALPRPPTHGVLVLAAGNITMLVEGLDPDNPASLVFTGVAAGTRIELVPLKVTAATATIAGLY
jgi:hypothetical protein